MRHPAAVIARPTYLRFLFQLPAADSRPRRRAARALARGSPLPQRGSLERGETREIENGRLSLTQVQQGDHQRPPLSARMLGERARVAPRGSWLTGDHDKFAGLDAHNSRN